MAADFDIREYLHQAMPFVQSAFAIEVWLEIPMSEARAHFALYRVAMQEENGGTTLRCGRDNLEAFAAMLLSLGCRVAVREPAALRETFAGLAKRAAQAAGVMAACAP